ncbi:hypothetical protein FE782_07215 [Paenibacillus antri]|uniref:Uncharacterized protein n=1 Tax=Paenibacillus antri TaxID=2582848 RepID=A0A5R9GMH0_9BACL|nr:hypothetical protein [Paenibacillus antri]TLS53145.1 hypothetical protein FE782_07215 [Paenibacillus antri]
MYKMSYGSILLMCFLIFALGGQDRLSWAPGPAMPETAVRTEARAEARPQVRIAAVDDVDAPPAATDAGRKKGDAVALPDPVALAAPVGLKSPTAEAACAAGFALSLPPEADERYRQLDWVTEEGVSATIRFEFANGGLLELTQSTNDQELDVTGSLSTAPPPPLPLPRMTPTASMPAIDIAWQDGSRRYALRSFGLTENETRAWIRSLESARAGCSAPMS